MTVYIEPEYLSCCEQDVAKPKIGRYRVGAVCSLGQAPEFGGLVEQWMEFERKVKRRLGGVGIEPVTTTAAISTGLQLASGGIKAAKESKTRTGCTGERHAVRANLVRANNDFTWVLGGIGTPPWTEALQMAAGDVTKAKVIIAEGIEKNPGNNCVEHQAILEWLAKYRTSQAATSFKGTPFEKEANDLAIAFRDAMNRGASRQELEGLSARLSALNSNINALSPEERMRAQALMSQLGLQNQAVNATGGLISNIQDGRPTDSNLREISGISGRLGDVESIVKGLSTKSPSDRADAQESISRLEPGISTGTIVAGAAGISAFVAIISLIRS